MTNRYPTLLSPIRVGNHILKNRMTHGPSSPHFIQGGENYPTDAFIQVMANRAAGGAALITCSGIRDMPPGASNVTGDSRHTMGGRFTLFDIYDPQAQEYISQLVEAIHYYGSLATMEIFPPDFHLDKPNYDISSGIPSLMVEGDGHASKIGEEIPEHQMKFIADYMANQSLLLKDCGFDGVFVHMSYKATLLGRSLSRITNKRTDKYGGSLENRCRFPFMVCDRIKEVCGKDFIIEASISGYDPLPDGWTLEETTEFMKLAEGHIDIVQLRNSEIDPAHPTGYNPEARPFVYMAEAAKKANSSVLVSTIGGYLDPEASEEILAAGKADIIAMARPWISNPDYGKLVKDGRAEDIVPCIRCNKCHRSSYADPWTSVCSVNPKHGLEHKLDRMIKPVERIKKVAVVGGGVAGMKAAILLSERGHRVTLFEKSGRLGGILNILDNVSFKWPVTNFKDYLVRQVEKHNITVQLGVEVTKEELLMDEFDSVVLAVGASPVIPPIPGVEREHVITAIDAYAQPDRVRGRVVVIGGGEIGVECGMYMCDLGHEAKVLEMAGTLAQDSTPIHFYTMFRTAWQSREGFSSEVNARVTRIEDNGVYFEREGEEHFVHADTVILAAGMKANVDEAFALSDSSVYDSFRIGDCVHAGNIQKAQRSALGAASNI